jgi:hypothetical protein
MIKEPEIGAAYWTTDEFWSQDAVVPVKIVSYNAENGYYQGIWELGEGYAEEYNYLEPSHLYDTDKEAWDALRIERRLVERRERSGAQ